MLPIDRLHGEALLAKPEPRRRPISPAGFVLALPIVSTIARRDHATATPAIPHWLKSLWTAAPPMPDERAIEQVGAGYQCPDRPDVRSHHTADTARARRRRDRL